MVTTQSKIVVGGLYAVQNDDETYGVYKVLAIDWNVAVSLRRYTNKFESCPAKIDPSTLTLGMKLEEIKTNGIDLNSMGIGHFPLHHDGFWEMNPLLIQVEQVTEDELSGYRMWMQGPGDSDRDPAAPTASRRWWQFWK
jgi:hypothetical protein